MSILTNLKRLRGELLGERPVTPSPGVRREGDVARVEHGAPTALEEAEPARLVRIEPDVYCSVSGSDRRTALLRAAAKIAAAVEVHVPLTAVAASRGRLALDGPRRLLRLTRPDGPEPGDRLEGSYHHLFFDDEEPILEAARAGLAFVARRRAWLVFARARIRYEPVDPFAFEAVRVLRVIRDIDEKRSAASLERMVDELRARGRNSHRRGPIGRARLRRAIAWADATLPLPGGPNCFRRTLAELALDAGAAEETLAFGLDVGKTGHVAFANSEERTFDVVFELPPRG